MASVHRNFSDAGTVEWNGAHNFYRGTRLKRQCSLHVKLRNKRPSIIIAISRAISAVVLRGLLFHISAVSVFHFCVSVPTLRLLSLASLYFRATVRVCLCIQAGCIDGAVVTVSSVYTLVPIRRLLLGARLSYAANASVAVHGRSRMPVCGPKRALADQPESGPMKRS